MCSLSGEARSQKVSEGSIQSRLAKALLVYRLTPQSTTDVSPAELLLGKRPRSRLDLLKPHTADRVERQQQKQKEQHDAKAKQRRLQVGDNDFVRNFQHGEKWLPGTILKKTGPVSFLVKMSGGNNRCCHQDQIRNRFVEVEGSIEPPEVDIPNIPHTAPPVVTSTSVQPPDCSQSTVPIVGETSDDSTTTSGDGSTHTESPPTLSETVPQPTIPKSYPTCVRKPVDRFEPTF